MEGIETLQRWVDESSRIVFFGGAGVSTESGIPDFRSVDGLYHQQYQYPPETILSRSFFDRQPEEFYRFYRGKMLCLDARPNAAHKKLAELERGGRLRSVVTQNIDGLHRRQAPSGCGSSTAPSCATGVCPAKSPGRYPPVAESAGVPRCTCGGVIKPDVVLYEESLDARVLEGALEDIQQADLLIIGGPRWWSIPPPGW